MIEASSAAGKPRVAMLGLGIMGGAMARNLAAAGLPLSLYSKSASTRERFSSLGRIAESAADAASGCHAALLCVSDREAVLECLFGPRGIAGAVEPPRLVIDLSTIQPSTAKECHTRLADIGISFLDAPVSGGDVGARNATLTIMAGGEPETFESAKPILAAIGKTIVHTGPAGSGQLTKCVNQIAVALTVAAMTEGLELASKSGLDLEKTLSVLRGGAAGSWSLDNYAPRLLAGDVAPGFKAEHMLKDLRIAIEEARTIGLDLPCLTAVERLYDKLCRVEPGLGNHALCKAYGPST